MCGWTEGVSGSDPERITENAGTALHCAHGAEQPELRELERTENGGGGFETGLPRVQR